MKLKKQPFVSVIIPVYNAEKYLHRCIDSVLKQSYDNYEIILVNNNSSDNSKDIIADYQENHSNIRSFFEQKISRGAARNKGEIHSKGKIILMTDSDCIVPYDWILHIITPIIEEKAIAVQGSFALDPSNENYYSRNIQHERKRMVAQRLQDTRIGLLNTANFAITKEALQEVGFSNKEIVSGNDTDLEVRLKQKRYAIAFQDIQVIHFEANNICDVVRKMFIRGYWNSIIRRSYGEPSFFGAHNHILFILSILHAIFRLKKNTVYNLVSGLSWRMGVGYSYLTA